ncbi:bifunctional metallophosphatase/5'-nucleotidase [Metabacillus litoralis]|uniref:Bifunctional metallophosphatase/5'-nucleotidase n=1 Tax=Metabacillus litoralis TaxID=152268 RepID=A0A5C6W1N6_9BACI|nr:bifunctional UDP-sugar hydrolase/5'-nucleotidase [Metabacillus litoralis]TXC91185.1 bifunctional metallophosphatase/5'-nucleotidase [Metabacillus litoralis]
MIETIHLYHTNDLHSHFENWPKIVRFLQDRKKLHELDNEEMLLVDIGDHADRFHPITEATKGKANVSLLNQLHYNAVTIGNNEGITFAHEDLNELYREAEFSVIISNFYTEHGERPEWVIPYEIKTLKNGYRVAFLGVTVFYEKFYELLGWKVKDPFESLLEVIQEIKGQADMIVLLSHLGITDDERIADDFPDIDIIIGGHTHHVLQKGKKINSTLVAGAGKYGQYIGYISIGIDTSNKQLLEKKAELFSTIELHAICKETALFLNHLYDESEQILSEEIGVLDQELSVDWFNDSPFPHLLVTAIREWCDGEVAMVNSGILLESLQKGPVTRKNIHHICPHPINPCKVYLKGDVLKEVILQSRDEKMEQLQLKGLGFRGKVMGRMVFDGIIVKTELLSDGKKHVTEILIKNQTIDPDRLYAVATIDMFTLGPLYPEISHAEKKIFYMPELLRDVLAWKLGKYQIKS